MVDGGWSNFAAAVTINHQQSTINPENEMSRIGKRPIPLPKGIEITVGEGQVTVKGPKGTLTKPVHPDMILKSEDGILHVERPSESKEHRSLHGLTRTIVANMVE